MRCLPSAHRTRNTGRPTHVPQLENLTTVRKDDHRRPPHQGTASNNRPAEGLYGRRKMTAHLRRKGHHVAACTIDRLMRDEGLNGVVRGRQHRTTIPGGKDSRRAPDLLDRDFTADAPNRTWVTDFTYCRTWAGFVYVAFVIDCFSRAIVGWHASTVKVHGHGHHGIEDGIVATRSRWTSSW
ncbi:DDE-type integrase/transposase/recombinase [Rhodococcus sp. MS16]|uniref:DDE-type integrase/transposase/recombinase n=1 Tax=Rhodococcus sp. MS16 TaxID=2579941 RepID=UPI0023DE1990|nr:DDE-type integrase/transposase/recombinase [Rhodococcus sp. MS16]NRI69831.1 DDE-type integrase/transposase/recombinase [Rhodococcus sp. MS16]